MGTSRRASAIVRRSFSWASSFMAIAAAAILGKVDDVQATPDIRLNDSEMRKQVIDQTMGYIAIGDYDEEDGWNKGGNQ